MGLFFVLCIIYACFVLHNLCELQDINIDDDAVARQVAHDISQPKNAPDQLYSFKSQCRNISRISNQFRKIEFWFIPPKQPFGMVISENDI